MHRRAFKSRSGQNLQELIILLVFVALPTYIGFKYGGFWWFLPLIFLVIGWSAMLIILPILKLIRIFTWPKPEYPLCKKGCCSEDDYGDKTYAKRCIKTRCRCGDSYFIDYHIFKKSRFLYEREPSQAEPYMIWVRGKGWIADKSQTKPVP